MNAPAGLDDERRRFVKAAMDLIEKRGEGISKAGLASGTGVPRARIDALFPEEQDLFAAIVDEWYSHDVSVMEEVCASDLPPRRKMYEFYVRRYRREKERYDADPATFALYCELGEAHFDAVQGYIELADHYLTEIIAEAQAEGHFKGLTLARALTLINQMTVCYTSPQMMLIISDRLAEDKLAAIVDTLFAGLTAEDGGASGVTGLKGV